MSYKPTRQEMIQLSVLSRSYVTPIGGRLIRSRRLAKKKWRAVHSMIELYRFAVRCVEESDRIMHALSDLESLFIQESEKIKSKLVAVSVGES